MALTARVVGGDELRRLVPMKDAIAAVRDAYIASAKGEFSSVPRIGAPSHTLFVMLSERKGRDGRVLGQSVKVVSYHEENPAASRPVVQGVVLWFDGETGEARFALDGEVVTALRTGAASGVATDLFAPAEIRKLAVVGTGAAAPDQARAVCAVRQIESISVTGRDFGRAEIFAKDLAAEFPHVRVSAARSVSEAVADADVICTATTSRAPLFELSEVKPTVHINAIGAFSPQMCEIGPDVVAAARLVCVDDRAALADCGDLVEPLNAKRLDASSIALIGDLLGGERTRPQAGITLFKSIGIAAQDWAIGARVASIINV
jgi:ornithine cyclodeaminase